MGRLSDLSDEIAACERDLSAHRTDLSRALDASSRGVRRRASSPPVLLGLAAAGFIIGRLTLRPERGSGDSAAPAVAKGAGAVGLLSGIGWAIVRGQLATPDSWLNRHLHERMQRSRPPVDPTIRPASGASRNGTSGGISATLRSDGARSGEALHL